MMYLHYPKLRSMLRNTTGIVSLCLSPPVRVAECDRVCMSHTSASLQASASHHNPTSLPLSTAAQRARRRPRETWSWYSSRYLARINSSFGFTNRHSHPHAGVVWWMSSWRLPSLPGALLCRRPPPARSMEPSPPPHLARKPYLVHATMPQDPVPRCTHLAR